MEFVRGNLALRDHAEKWRGRPPIRARINRHPLYRPVHERRLQLAGRRARQERQSATGDRIRTRRAQRRASCTNRIDQCIERPAVDHAAGGSARSRASRSLGEPPSSKVARRNVYERRETSRSTFCGVQRAPAKAVVSKRPSPRKPVIHTWSRTTRAASLMVAPTTTTTSSPFARRATAAFITAGTAMPTTNSSACGW
jgi:hypothetical protein